MKIYQARDVDIGYWINEYQYTFKVDHNNIDYGRNNKLIMEDTHV